MKRLILVLTIFISVFGSGFSVCQASWLDTLDIAVNFVTGVVQEDNNKLGKEIIDEIKGNPAKQQALSKYIVSSRAIVKKHHDRFSKYGFPVCLWVDSKIPLVGGIMSAVLIKGYGFLYEKDLNDAAKDEVSKKFAILREHSIDAKQDAFERTIDFFVDNEKPDVLVGVNFQQLTQQANEADGVMKQVLAQGNIDMFEVDIGNIFPGL